jgi:hypothetical protein
VREAARLSASNVVPILPEEAQAIGAGEMARVGYCGECGRYVELTAQGECPVGHPRSSLRDVREGSLAEAPAVARARADREGEVAEMPEPALGVGTGVLAKLIGWGIVVVPAALVVGWGLWAGYEEAASNGAPSWVALMISAGSLAVTFAVAFAWVWIRRHRR